jgi:PEGA domain
MRNGFPARAALIAVLLISYGARAQTTSQANPPAAPPSFRLEDGTPVKLRISQTVSSETAHVDDRVEFEVLEEVKVGDVVVIPKAALALGTVTEAQPKRRMARGGKLEIVMDSVRLADGEKAALRATKEVKGGGHTGGMTAGIVATGLIFWPAAPFFLFMHGKEITIPKDTQVPTFINGDFPLDLAKFQPALSAGQPQQPAPAQPDTAQVGTAPTAPPSVMPSPQQIDPATVVIKSTPDGADITIDGKFVGSTPSTIRLPPGDHEIVIQKTGSSAGRIPGGEVSLPTYRSWKRTLTLSPGGTISVDATLELMQ